MGMKSTNKMSHGTVFLKVTDTSFFSI